MKGKDIILGILSTSDKTGYEINDILQNQLSYFCDGTYGMIYPTLKKLEQAGSISKQEIIQSGKPNKNIYSITDKGQREFAEYLSADVAPSTFKSDFLLHLFFGADLPKEQVEKLIKEELARKKGQLQQLLDNYQMWQQQGISQTQLITVNYGIVQYKAVIEFLQSQLDELN
ncbi:PadR family transcriptional regulator [Bombilactobacillus folatiphilus]|uniref:PadR family transcriptional regulator n=1 Tax=Bombilactobacillus folatiphilus TaxID=2923362 RepID=A0ABY4P907_9LACO|nr:PadR family transcriptional regulator [Bombilactobacillus folatiphilus]UQS82213.1 PadR family transcriptional regulator [Bombilactobacillus folatiphilus]